MHWSRVCGEKGHSTSFHYFWSTVLKCQQGYISLTVNVWRRATRVFLLALPSWHCNDIPLGATIVIAQIDAILRVHKSATSSKIPNAYLNAFYLCSVERPIIHRLLVGFMLKLNKETIVSPTAELQIARLLVERKPAPSASFTKSSTPLPLNIDMTHALVNGRRVPAHKTLMRHTRLCHNRHLVVTVGAEKFCSFTTTAISHLLNLKVPIIVRVGV